MVFYFLIQINLFSSFNIIESHNRKTLETYIAVKREITIHIQSINQNHLIILIQKINSISETNNHVKLESQIADQDLLNHISVESRRLFHFLISSFILSNMRIFASIAIQIDKINHAIDARVNTNQKNLTTVKTKITYKINAIDDISPDNL